MPPFSVLHVCLGNICRSPMAERLFALRVSERLPQGAEQPVLSTSCGIADWNTGASMDRSAARELNSRGGDDSGFRARHMASEHVESADLILTATQEQVDYIAAEYGYALDRTFLIRHFGMIVDTVTQDELPSGDASPADVYARGTALVKLADRRRDIAVPEPLDDPWRGSAAVFTRIGDEIDAALAPLVNRLLP